MEGINFNTSDKIKFWILYFTLRREYEREIKIETEIKKRFGKNFICVTATKLHELLEQIKEQNAINFLVAEHRYDEMYSKKS